MGADAHALCLALDDPHQVCDHLELLDGRRGHEWRLQSGGVMVLCPWHEERSPSCSVTRGPDGTIRAVCFACNAKGDVLTLIAAVGHLDIRRDFSSVLRAARDLAGLPPTELPRSRTWRDRTALCTRTAPTRTAPTRTADDSAGAAMNAVLELCPLTGARDVVAYLDARGMPAIGSACGAIPADGSAQQNVLRALADKFGWGLLCDLGVASPDHRLARPDHRLLLPWRAPGADGSIVTIQRRLVRAARDGEPKYVFLPGRSPCWPFGVEQAVEELGAGTAVALVEGALDTIAYRHLCRRAGLDRVVLGLPGLTWRREWARFVSGREVLIALDDDDAGNRRVPDLARELSDAGATGLYRAVPRGGKDWAALLESGRFA